MEGEDGRWFIVGSPFNRGRWSIPPEMTMHYLSPGTDINDVLDQFRELYGDFRRNAPDFIPRRIESFEDAAASHARQMAAVAAYRKSIGWITLEDLRNSGANRFLAPWLLRACRKELRKQGMLD